MVFLDVKQLKITGKVSLRGVLAPELLDVDLIGYLIGFSFEPKYMTKVL